MLKAWIGVVALIGSALVFGAAATQPAATQDGIAVYFSPKGGCTDAIVREIAAANSTLHVQAYHFTSNAIAKAVLAAKQRGVAVMVLLDKSQEDAATAANLANDGVPVRIDAKESIAHNKVILIDGETIITGSFNFTTGAELNSAENLLIIKGKPELSVAYEKNFQSHMAHATEYRIPDAKAPTTLPAEVP